MRCSAGASSKVGTGTISPGMSQRELPPICRSCARRSEEHTSELQSLMRISYAVFCLKKKTNKYVTNRSYLNHSYTHSTKQLNKKHKTQEIALEIIVYQYKYTLR